jgi:heat shock protein HslJ
MNGFGGCNHFTGSYKLDAVASRVRFGQIATTSMMCTSGMEVEQAFYEALGNAENYSLAGDQLTLNRARMAPLARSRQCLCSDRLTPHVRCEGRCSKRGRKR